MTDLSEMKLLKIEIAWNKRVAKVTSVTGGHVAKCLDLGDKMQIEIYAKRKPK